MDRTKAVNRRADLFGAGKDGYHLNDDMSGMDATYNSPEAMNSFQEELVGIIEGFGGVPDAEVLNQVYQILAAKLALKANASSLATKANADDVLMKAGGTMTGNITLADIASSGSLCAGFRGSPIVVANAARTFALTDEGKTIVQNDNVAHNWTIPADATTDFPIGAVIALLNDGDSNNISVVAAADVTLVRNTTTGTQTVAPGMDATIQKVAANRWRFRG